MVVLDEQNILERRWNYIQLLYCFLLLDGAKTLPSSGFLRFQLDRESCFSSRSDINNVSVAPNVVERFLEAAIWPVIDLDKSVSSIHDFMNERHCLLAILCIGSR